MELIVQGYFASFQQLTSVLLLPEEDHQQEQQQQQQELPAPTLSPLPPVVIQFANKNINTTSAYQLFLTNIFRTAIQKVVAGLFAGTTSQQQQPLHNVLQCLKSELDISTPPSTVMTSVVNVVFDTLRSLIWDTSGNNTNSNTTNINYHLDRAQKVVLLKVLLNTPSKVGDISEQPLSPPPVSFLSLSPSVPLLGYSQRQLQQLHQQQQQQQQSSYFDDQLLLQQLQQMQAMEQMWPTLTSQSDVYQSLTTTTTTTTIESTHCFDSIEKRQLFHWLLIATTTNTDALQAKQQLQHLITL